MNKVLIGSIRGPRGPVGTIEPAVLAAAVESYLAANPPTSGIEFVQSELASTWTINHDFGRPPAVTVYIDGEIVETDVTATDTQVTVTFPAPYMGSVILT